MRAAAIGEALARGEEFTTEDLAEWFGLHKRSVAQFMDPISVGLCLYEDDMGTWRYCDDARAVCYTETGDNEHGQTASNRTPPRSAA
jgi:hypothetical protein